MSDRRNGLNFPTAVFIVILICIGLLKVIIDTINNTFNSTRLECNSRVRQLTLPEDPNTFNVKNDKGDIYAIVVLSSDNDLITFNVNTVGSDVLNSVEFIHEDQTIKIVDDIQETEYGYVANGMWAEFNEPPFLSSYVDILRKGKMYIKLKFDSSIIIGQLLPSNKSGSFKLV